MSHWECLTRRVEQWFVHGYIMVFLVVHDLNSVWWWQWHAVPRISRVSLKEFGCPFGCDNGVNQNSHRHWLCHMLKLIPLVFSKMRGHPFFYEGNSRSKGDSVLCFFVWFLLLCISGFVEYHMMFPELWILKRYLTKHHFVTGRRWFGSPESQGQTSAFSQILALSAVSIGTAVEPQNSRRWNLTGYTWNCIDTIWCQIPDLFTTSQLCWRKRSNLTLGCQPGAYSSHVFTVHNFHQELGPLGPLGSQSCQALGMASLAGQALMEAMGTVHGVIPKRATRCDCEAGTSGTMDVDDEDSSGETPRTGWISSIWSA